MPILHARRSAPEDSRCHLRARQHARRCLALPLVLSLSLAAVQVTFTPAAAAQPDWIDDGRLRIVSWNLSDAADAGVLKRESAPAPQRTWRNTFGAERRIEDATGSNFDVDRLKADVVLLQGIRSVRHVRELFPAREWKVILSRQILAATEGHLGLRTRLPGDATTTAVAVRYQRSVRVTGLEHLTDLTDPSLASAPPAERVHDVRSAPLPTAQAGVPQAEESPAGLAVRITHSGRLIWVVTAALSPECLAAGDTCLADQRLSDWLVEKRRAGHAVLLGGQFGEHARKALGERPAGSRCAGQAIAVDPELPGKYGADTLAGCLAFFDH